MRMSGIIEHNNNDKIPYYISIPELEIHSQGTSVKNSYEMILDAFGELLYEHTKGKASKKDLKIIPIDKYKFDISTDKIKEVSAFIISRLRSFSNMTQEEVADKMGKSSRRSVTAYEYVESEAGLSKFQEIMSALGYDVKLSFIPKNKAA